MTYKWTPHQIFKDIFDCETGDANTIAKISYLRGEWQALITVETEDEYIYLTTWRETKVQAMAAIEVQLSDLLSNKS